MSPSDISDSISKGRVKQHIEKKKTSTKTHQTHSVWVLVTVACTWRDPAVSGGFLCVIVEGSTTQRDEAYEWKVYKAILSPESPPFTLNNLHHCKNKLHYDGFVVKNVLQGRCFWDSNQPTKHSQTLCFYAFQISFVKYNHLNLLRHNENYLKNENN